MLSNAWTNLIYVAGPYRAHTEWGVLENIRRAEAAAMALWKKGWVVFCPHKNTAFFGGELPESTWLLGGMVILRRCDAICLIEGWRESVGARAELLEAKAFRLKVYESVEEVPAFKI